MANICIHCFVTGKVQGVFFRYNTRLVARNLGLTGWVKNLDDVRVELIACGEKNKVEQLYEWLFTGPIDAKITTVERIQTEWQEFDQFESIH